MRFQTEDLLLYAVTDRTWLAGQSLATAVENALRGGVTLIQLREKDPDPMIYQEEARQIKTICDRYEVPLIINDDVSIALACGANGVHLGQLDGDPALIRRRLGPDRIIGVSVRTLEQALTAQAKGADYIGVGAIFPTSTKTDARPVSRDTLKAICQAVSIPVVAIGGITQANGPALSGTGIAGIAVISALFAQPDIEAAAAQLSGLAHWITKGSLGLSP